jgi:hypothetical protein
MCITYIAQWIWHDPGCNHFEHDTDSIGWCSIAMRSAHSAGNLLCIEATVMNNLG